ncbi:MAG: NAD-dependent epimerase/dehydratase family protein [Verrucomicrobiales bacterium]
MHLLLCGHGYLGQAISRDFLAAGWHVTAISKSGSPASEGALTSEVVDLSSQASIQSLASGIEKPDFIVHCAASDRGGAEAYRAVYLEGCHHLCTNFPESPVLFTSSTSVYAQIDGSVVTEESPAEPDRETGQILRAAEKIVLGHHGIVFRLAGIYGPQRSAILKKFLAGQSTMEDDGARFLNQIHRDDAANAVLLAATRPLEYGIYNVCDSTPRSQRDTFASLSRQFSLPMPPTVPRNLTRKRGWTHKQVSNQKLRSHEWAPRYPDALQAASAIAATL